MKVTLIPSCLGAKARPGPSLQYLTSFLVNDTVAVDAGSLGFYGSAADQAAVKHVLISHSHMDHIASLPAFLENVFSGGPDCVTIHASKAVLDALRQDVFNNRLWPDFVDLSRRKTPFMKLARIVPGKKLEIAGLRITPVPVDHIVPTLGFVVEDAEGAVVFAGDTGPTEALWKQANAAANLKAVFLEATFPNAMTWLAEAAGHLTPATFAQELRKLKRPVPVIAVHIKARYYDQVTKELAELRLPQLRIGEGGVTYTF